MNLSDKILDELGLKYEDLNIVERETYQQAVFSVQNLSLDDVKVNIVEMKNAIAMQLCDIPDDTEHQDINCKLKARLKNYLVLEAFLTVPEKAEKALRNSLQNMKNNTKKV